LAGGTKETGFAARILRLVIHHPEGESVHVELHSSVRQDSANLIVLVVEGDRAFVYDSIRPDHERCGFAGITDVPARLEQVIRDVRQIGVERHVAKREHRFQCVALGEDGSDNSSMTSIASKGSPPNQEMFGFLRCRASAHTYFLMPSRTSG
jgi:hypothetical protein